MLEYIYIYIIIYVILINKLKINSLKFIIIYKVLPQNMKLKV